MRLAHADWSKDPKRRWVARADFDTVYEPEPARGLPDADLIGFDFPIGLPVAYARLAGITNFVEALRTFGPDFYAPCENAEEISVRRPFYPARPGGTSPKHLEAVFGPDRLRRCDRVAGGAELFWLIGAKHPGHAAIAGWRDLLAPALREERITIWPFTSGTGKPVVAECYPALAYRWLGIPSSFGKRDRAARARQAPLLRAWADRTGVKLEADVEGGFADDDAFDAFVGVIGMLEVALGRRPTGEPEDDEIGNVEGWILGLDGTDRRSSS